MWKKILVVSVFTLIVGGSLAMSKKTDAEVLTKVGRTASEQVSAAMPDRTAVAGPLAAVQVGDLTAVDEKVRLRLKTDAALESTKLTVTADQGVVKLTGRVDTAAQRERAVQLAQSTLGVTKVEQEIAVPEGK
jgi:osmotically-inducible protein OsmY